MTTAHKGGAIRKHMAQRGYAGGGLLDTLKSAVGMQTSKQVMDAKVDAEMRKRERHGQQLEPAAAPAVAAASAPTDIFSKTLKRREAEAGLANGGAIKGPRGAIRNLAQKKSPEGAKLKGPGTATSDSIPAKVVDTGEPINVATDERIISKKQDAFLLAQAKADGFDSIDAWLEAGTGQPVGPTIKYTPGGKVKAAAAGMAPQDDLQLKSATPTSPYQQMDAKANDTGVAPGVVGDAPSPAGIMGSTGQTAPISNIPGYTPGMIQRSGMGLVGGQQVEGPSAMVPRREGDVSFSKGGAIRRKMMPGRGSDPHGIRMGAPGAGRGPIRAMADGASAEDLKKPIPGSGQMPYGEQMRNLGGALVDAPVAAIKTLVSAPGYGFNKTATAPAVQTAPTPAAPSAPTTAYQPAKDPAGYGGGAVRPATAPAGEGQPATLSGATGKDVGYGVTRFDVAGKSPLFTNVTDGAGMASNEKLINRGAVSEQNLGALRGIQQRQDIGDLARAQKSQYDAEVAGARAINTAPAPYDPEAGARALVDLTSPTNKAISNLSTRDRFGRLQPGNQQAIDAIIKQTLADPRALQVADGQNATTRRGQDVIARGQDINAEAAGAKTQIERQRLGLEMNQDQRVAAQAEAAQRAQARIESLHNAYTKTTGKDRETIAEQLRMMTNKDKPDQWKAIALQGSTDAMGNKTEGVLAAVNSSTGEMRRLDQGGGAKPAPYQEGATIKSKTDGKTYVVKNGVPVPI